MKIKCSTCGKEYLELSDAYTCCVRQEEDHLISDVDVTLDTTFQHINVDWIDNVTTTQH